MASGHGVHTGEGRCYSLFNDISICRELGGSLEECRDFFDDYMECLHGTNTIRRNKDIADKIKGSDESKFPRYGLPPSQNL